MDDRWIIDSQYTAIELIRKESHKRNYCSKGLKHVHRPLVG